MGDYKKLTPTNGFDFKDLLNARQNNYAWSMGELGEYIYVGTGRNIVVSIIKAMATNFGVDPNDINFPISIKPNSEDNLGEIWRYKKDGSLPWKRVFKAETGSGIQGFRFMISNRPFGGNPCLYAAAFGDEIKILKTTNGVDWEYVNNEGLEGTSSRAMVIHRRKVYVATINEFNLDETPLLYASREPEFYSWESVIGSGANNPKGAITNMEVFNNRVYVATSSEDGVQVWRSRNRDPKPNEWVCIVDKGFGDAANTFTLSIGVFGQHLYVSASKLLPLSWIIPFGCDIIRIDKRDNWRLVVGGPALIKTNPIGHRGKSLSGLGSGFDNPFNVYAWQIQEYKGKLLVSTFDSATNVELILDLILANRDLLEAELGIVIVEALIRIFELAVRILNEKNYPFGFNLYVSDDGIHFDLAIRKGLCNRYNYGGRILYVDKCNDLYIGTANPYQGCEVWRTDNVLPCYPCYSNQLYSSDPGEIYNEIYAEAEEDLAKVQEKMPEVIEILKNIK
ncbi:hypothetical protein [Clostridium septicum]|uniref:Uncharacterized protein n=1 Tax=Clostridium septicum TaxID=1504 RepID=A0A9N7JLY8_CLOSE|nr:hypothetical protein [Clostridium septicum]AYE34624.1 hypothetical protein CP523_09395 [Clostridium septicum]QAS60024.1 hypothetical protein EI377_04140 [Clostridium septicum]UEC20734.1 hypothetical protein LK444_15435 [Clostridium septicum]USS01215.1 hypothetical protein NH397_01735 [Clostridium septicum]